MKTIDMKSKIKERTLQIACIAIMIVVGLMAFYALRIILWVGYALGFTM